MKKNIFILIFAFSLTRLHGQDSTYSSGFRFLGTQWKNGFIGLMIGASGERPYHSRYQANEETKFLKPGQQLLPYNRNDFNSNGNYYATAGGAFINPYISFHPWNKKEKSFNKNQELRIGIIYYGNTGGIINYNNKYDASTKGDTTLISKVTFKNQRDDLGLNIGYTASSDEFWHRFSLYTGLDVGMAYSITHNVLQGTNEYTYSSVKRSYYSYDVSYRNYQYKELKGIPSFSMRGNLLAGMNLRIVKPVILFTEGRFGYSYIQPIGGTASLQTHFNINIGFKFGF